ncbi:hypothetical protein FRC02_003608 [Tulasnella sp. 418]|nr:hypothetical protein FRC02_003608 [Tulasnella sp. 418]
MSLPAQPVSALSLRQRVRSSKWIPQTRVMMAISPQLSNFERDHTSNLFSLCPNHHGEYGSGEFALLPRPTVREQLRNYEEADFAARQAHANAQNEILGRTLPFLTASAPTCSYSGASLCPPVLAETSSFTSRDELYAPCRNRASNYIPNPKGQKSHLGSAEELKSIGTIKENPTSDPSEAESSAQAALSTYQQEPAVSPEELDKRTPLYPGKPPHDRWWEYEFITAETVLAILTGLLFGCACAGGL